jgi:hypothetical protein
MAIRLRISVVFLAAISCCAIGASSASAATTFGFKCIASSATVGSRVQTASPSTLDLYRVPSAGVITSWGTSVIPYPGGITAKLMLLKPGAAPNTYDVLATSASGNVVGGDNIFPTNLAVSGGETIALYGGAGAVYCPADPSDASASLTIATEPAVGTTVTAAPANASTRVSLTATVEPDADHDGFGDDTQDGCPQSALFSTPCPQVKLAKRILPPGKKSVEVLLTTNTAAGVSVSGSVSIKLPGAKKPTSFSLAEVTKTVDPGELASMTAKFPPKLTKALKKFPSSKKFSLKLTVAGTGVINTDTSVSVVRLRGTK